MPVFTVGVGEESLTRDVQVTRAEMPRRVLKGSALVVDVVVTQTGYAGAKVPLIVEDQGRMVSTQDITLPADGESATVKVRFKAFEAGPRVYRFRIPLQSNEEVPQNNARDRLVEVVDRREKHPLSRRRAAPRAEVRPARDGGRRQPADRAPAAHGDGDVERAGQVPAPRRRHVGGAAGRLPGDARGALRVPRHHPRHRRGERVLARAAADARGLRRHPRRRADDARRSAIVLRRRLGRHAALERAAGRARARVAQSDRAAGGTHRQADARGREPSATQIADTAEATAAKWSELPPLTTVNNVVEVKPGATVLLNGLDESRVAIRWCSPGSATAAARRWRCPCRTRGCGACTRRWTSRTRPTSRSGSGWRAGSWTACRIA